jgi:hypothetical protein
MRDWLASCSGCAMWVQLEAIPGAAEQDRSFAICVYTKNGAGNLADFKIAECHPHPSHLWIDDAVVAGLANALR